MLFRELCLAVAGVSTAYAFPSSIKRTEYAVKERHTVPLDWTEVGSAAKSDIIHLQIGLKQQNEGVIEQHLVEISDPNHARYGQHLSAAEVHEIVAPSEESINLVQAWLADHSIDNVAIHSAKDWISVLVSIDEAEELLQTSYKKYWHVDGSSISRAPEWSLPLHLHQHIDVVQPTNSFFRAKREIQQAQETTKPQLDTWTETEEWYEDVGKYELETNASASTVAAVCNISFTTPKCLRTLYGTIDYKPQVPGQNKIAIDNFLNETNKRSDIHKFLKHFRPAAVAAAEEFHNVIIANANHDQGPYTAKQIKAEKNIEGDLDAELVLSIAWPTPLTAFSTGGSPPFHKDLNTPTDTNEPYLTLVNYLLAQTDLPQVFSTSYGDDEQTVPHSYAKRVCHGFAQLGARGISVLFSSGDAGVGSNGTCFSNKDPEKRMFIPNFPASCPWVTTVGATAGFEPEVAVSRFGSGGGFSNYFPAPSYQASTVQAYIASLNGEYDGLYNKSGRGYPDVAAQGNHDAIVWAGNITTVGGTSASCPTFSSVISLVNDALLAKGKPALGFLNPWIYGGAYSALTDITSGSAIGCNTTGFPAQAGWDAVTGWGTPKFGDLRKAALAE